MRRFSANISFMFNEYPMLERFAAAKRAGFGAIEIAFPYDTPVADLKAAKEAHGFDMTVMNVPAGDTMTGGPGNAAVPGREDEFKRALDQAVTYARALRPGAVNVLSGAPLKELERERCLDVMTRNATLAADAFAALGIPTIMEAINTHDRPGTLLSRTEEAMEVVRRANHPNLGIEFDIYHMKMMGEDLVPTATKYLKHIGNIQFADAPGRHEPGTGTCDFAAVFSGIEKAGWTGYFAAEYFPAGKTEDGLGWMKTFAS
jgi:hydroxypyruvate isomerase